MRLNIVFGALIVLFGCFWFSVGHPNSTQVEAGQGSGAVDRANSSSSNSTALQGRQAGASVALYDFIINEYSYKFWAVFQVTTIAILLYSVFAAIYNAKWIYLQDLESPDYDANLFIRSNPDPPKLDWSTIKRILDSINKPPPSD